LVTVIAFFEAVITKHQVISGHLIAADRDGAAAGATITIAGIAVIAGFALLNRCVTAA
jgi:hypothetical protein